MSQDRPFYLLKQAVSQRKTACFTTHFYVIVYQRITFGKPCSMNHTD